MAVRSVVDLPRSHQASVAAHTTASLLCFLRGRRPSAALVINNRCGRKHAQGVQVRHRQHRHVGHVADALVHVHVVAWRPPPAALAPSSFKALRIAAMSLVFGCGERQARRSAPPRCRRSSRPAPSAWPAAPPSSAGDTTNRAAAWRGCARRRGGCRCAASRPGRCPCPSGDTSSSSCRPLPRGSWSSTVPCRRLAWYITTTSCSNCLLMRGASSAGSISYVPTSAPLRS